MARLRSWAPVYCWVAVLAVVLLWPITGSGYLLARDMVFTPHQPLDLAAIGASTATPRAVPVDALVALAEHIVNGAVVARIAVLVPVVVGGVGAARLLGATSTAARLVTCGLATWNPYVVERLALGQWALLWGYAALPWVIAAVADRWDAAGDRGDRGDRGGTSGTTGRTVWRRWLRVAVPLAAASITPTGGLIAAVAAIATAAGMRLRRRDIAATVGLAVVMQLPWAVPALVSTAARTSDPAGVAAFAARAEHPGGVLLTLLGGGGIWDADVVPGSRTGALPWLGLLVLAGAAAIGGRRLVALCGSRLTGCLVGLGIGGLVLAALGTLPGGHRLLTTLVRDVPGAGLLRDGQKFVMPLVLLAALLAGAAADVLAARWRGVAWGGLMAVVALALPLLLLPDAAATLRPALRPVHYPSDWGPARALVRGGDALTLPLGAYRAFPWAPGRTVYDPASRLLVVPTVIDDRLAVDGRIVAGEDRRAQQVVSAATSGPAAASRLAALGIRWVLVEHRTAGPVPVIAGLQLVRGGSDVSVYRVPGAAPAPRIATERVAAVLTGDAVTVLVVVLLLVQSAGAGMRRSGRDQRPRSGHLGRL